MPDPAPEPNPFKSFLMAGFECSTHVSPRLGRHDLVRSTGHDRLAHEDYAAASALGMRTVREGLRWHLIETSPGRYDFSTVRPMIDAARETGTQVIWDLFHYGWPENLDIFSPAFVDRFSGLAGAFTRLLSSELPGPPVLAPVNEISFFSWAAGDHGLFFPYGRGRGRELKRQLARAAIHATEAAWAVDPRARIVHPDPVVHIVPSPLLPELADEAEGYRRAQWQGWDMICGRLDPDLGGHPKYLDLIGLNFYPSNQWEYKGERVVPDDPRWRPFENLTRDVWQRYGRPLLVTETGAEGDLRAPWLRMMAGAAERLLDQGLPLLGLCLYPILDHPGWDDGRHVRCGLWGFRKRGERRPHEPLELEVRRAAARLERAARSRPTGTRNR